MQDMKLNLLETHDRLLHFKKDQRMTIQQGAEDCLKRNALSLAIQDKSPYVYLFAHPRTADDGVTKRMLWQPRLTKPYAQTNSYLFRAQSKTDIMEICWLLPPEETWEQFKPEKVTTNELVEWSINQYMNNRKQLESMHPDDLSDDRIREIMRTIAFEMNQDKMFQNLGYGV